MIGVGWVIPMLLAVTLGAPGPPRYQPPVSAPISDEFRPPAEPWLAGNRGLEYDTTPGTAVTAIGPGLVVFAGSVADGLYVTVLHPDGIRSSYSFLAVISVSRGDRVRAGTVVGVAGDLFHLGPAREATTSTRRPCSARWWARPRSTWYRTNTVAHGYRRE